MTSVTTFTWDGLNARDVGARLGLPNVWMYAEVESTQDIAHALAEQGVPAGALVVADAQSSGRGRQGRSWSSQAGQGVWCTIVERPRAADAVGPLAIRVGLRLAEALDRFADARVQVKWPNDLVIPSHHIIPSGQVIPSNARDLHFQKLAGILTEARWSGATPTWVAVGVGVNVKRPDVDGAAGLREGTSRFEVLEAVVNAVRSGARESGDLTTDELQRFATRDALRGRRILSPAEGVVEGLDASGGLRVQGNDGVELHRSGTVRLAEEHS